MKIEFDALTDVGLKRKLNEDSILVNPDLGLFVVADGMGGHEGGEVASAMAVSTAEELFKHNKIQKNPLPLNKLIQMVFDKSSSKIFHKGNVESPEYLGMGTTMVLAAIDKKHIYFGNVGDSRVYLFRDDCLWQITEDHSLINEQIRAGVLSEEDAQFAAGKNVITRSVGFEKNVDADIFFREPKKGDKYLICSDGLSGLVPDFEITELMKKLPPKKLVKKAISMAKDFGGDDNISVIVVEFV